MLINTEQKFLERKYVKCMLKVCFFSFFFYLSSSYSQAVAAKAARQKDYQQHFGSRTRHNNLNINQVDEN